MARKMRIRTMSIVPTLFLGVEYCATFQAALYIESHSLMHHSEFHAASIALSRAADKRKLLAYMMRIPYSRLFSCGFNFRTAGAGRKLDFEKFFLPI